MFRSEENISLLGVKNLISRKKIKCEYFFNVKFCDEFGVEI